MKRNLVQLSHDEYDLVIIGGGIYGACCAWDAALRGLSVALVERDDFGGATSSNSLRIIHGGLRYLQHGDIRRMRESIRERRTLMYIAPHLVRPLPFLMPTYRQFKRSKWALYAALMVNDLIGYDRNRALEATKHLPRGRVLSRHEYQALHPELQDDALTGGAIWYDCQMTNSERLLIAILHAATASGAAVANYVEATGLLQHGDRVNGIVARDGLRGDQFEIRAKVVLNAAGPWGSRVINLLTGDARGFRQPLSKAMNLVVNRTPMRQYAVGVYSKRAFQDDDALVSSGSRLFFITPWRHLTVIGTEHLPYHGDPDALRVTEEEIQGFLDEVNEACPALALARDEVIAVHRGLLPMEESSAATGNVRLVKRYTIQDHARTDGVEGLISVVGVKFTTARLVAQNAIDTVFNKLGYTPPRCRTAVTPVYGGHIEQLEKFVKEETTKQAQFANAGVVQHLIHNYGAAYTEVLTPSSPVELITPDSPVIKAELLYAVREEMAQKLTDVLLRRTEFGLGRNPDTESLLECAELIAPELGWNNVRKNRECAEVQAAFAAATPSKVAVSAPPEERRAAI